MANFVAIDFETADQGRDSACAIGLVKVSKGKIVERRYRLIRPPRQWFQFTYLHGISWDDVSDQPIFAEVWSDLAPLVERDDLILAHNASFDRGVLAAGCQISGIEMPHNSFACTVKVARELWAIRPTKLPDVCEHLGIELRHHDADSDAHACAQIGLAAIREGFDLRSLANATKGSKRSSPRSKARGSTSKIERGAKSASKRSRTLDGSDTRSAGLTSTAPIMRHSLAEDTGSPALPSRPNPADARTERIPTKYDEAHFRPPKRSRFAEIMSMIVLGLIAIMLALIGLGWLSKVLG